MTKPSSFSYSSVFPCTPQELYTWHSREGALERLIPPWEDTSVIDRQGGIAPGGTAKLKLHAGPIPYTWFARHVVDEPGKVFKDIQIQGPFSLWEHTHLFYEHPDGCTLEDRIEFKLPAHSLLPDFAPAQVKKMLERIFSYRHQTLLQDIALHKRCSQKPLRILITGGSGVLGQALKPLLTTGGHEVWFLVRRTPEPDKNEIYWNPATGEIDTASFPPFDGIIHLAGDNIGKGRWTENKKKRVIASREQGTRLLVKAITEMEPKPKVLLSASAVGFYGDCQDICMMEEDSFGDHFISDVCYLWERAAVPAQEAGIRTVFMRIGVVLSPRGGALQRLLATEPVGFMKSFGDGSQYVSWISVDDMISSMLHALTCDDLEGPVNIAAPHPVTNGELMQVLAKVMRRPLLPAVPAQFLKMLYGQMASEVLLSGCRVSTKKLQQSGFSFRHPDIETGLRSILGKNITGKK